MIEEGIRPEEITPEVVSQHMFTTGIPDPDLIIRTSGEMRISNFLIWQGAYSEWYCHPTFWPDFDRESFLQGTGRIQQPRPPVWTSSQKLF